jgi:hypothetical protein
MEQLRNSLEITLYCIARDEGKAGYACRSNAFDGRERLIFEDGHKAGKAAALRKAASGVTAYHHSPD